MCLQYGCSAHTEPSVTKKKEKEKKLEWKDNIHIPVSEKGPLLEASAVIQFVKERWCHYGEYAKEVSQIALV